MPSTLVKFHKTLNVHQTLYFRISQQFLSFSVSCFQLLSPNSWSLTHHNIPSLCLDFHHPHAGSIYLSFQIPKALQPNNIHLVPGTPSDPFDIQPLFSGEEKLFHLPSLLRTISWGVDTLRDMGSNCTRLSCHPHRPASYYEPYCRGWTPPFPVLVWLVPTHPSDLSSIVTSSKKPSLFPDPTDKAGPSCHSSRWHLLCVWSAHQMGLHRCVWK